MIKLLQELQNDDWSVASNASKKLLDFKSDILFKELIKILESTQKANTVNIVSLTLKDLGSNNAVPFLINALYYPNNINNISTVLYALETLNCSKYFLDIFRVFCNTKSIDAKISAFNILKKQKFAVNMISKQKIIVLLQQSNLSDYEIKLAKNIIKQNRFLQNKKFKKKKI